MREVREPYKPVGRVGERKKSVFLASLPMPVSLSVFSFAPGLLFDCLRLPEYSKVRTVLQSNYYMVSFLW